MCANTASFGGKKRLKLLSNRYHVGTDNKDGFYKTPFIPYIPCLGIFVNYYLISQLEILGIALLLGFLASTVIFYFCYGAKHSLDNTGEWDQCNTEGTHGGNNFLIDGGKMPEFNLLTHGEILIRS